MKIVVPEILIRGLKSDEKDEFESSYKSSAWMLNKMRRHLEKELSRLVKKSEDEENFGKAAWAEFQAANIAERRALRRLINLLPKVS